MTHAVLAPSSAHQWVSCAGMLTLARNYPEDAEAPEAREGQAAHFVAAQMLDVIGIHAGEGDTVPPGITVTPEMLEGARLYRQAVVDATDGRLDRVHVEERVLCSLIHEACFGTPDAWHFNKEAGILDVWDFKFGFRYVEVYENWQMLCYVAGILGQLGIPDEIRIRVHIIQPRSFHRDGPVRSWEFSSVTFAPYLEQLRKSAHEAMAAGARTRVGAWCRNCLAARGCEALAAASYDAVAVSGSSVPFDLSAAEVGSDLRTLQRAAAALSARITGLEQQAIEQIRLGQYVPYWQMGAKRTNLAWRLPDEEIIALGPLFGVDLARPPKPITPTQAREKLKVDEAVINSYAFRPSGELKLVPADISQARKVFSK